MKIQLLPSFNRWGTPFKVGKTYNATLPDFTNKKNKRVIRFVQNGKEISINSVIIQTPKTPGDRRKNAELTKLLIDKDFQIVDFPEHDEIFAAYKTFKTKTPRVKLICPKGTQLRDGFRPFQDDDEADKICAQLGTLRCKTGRNGERCDREGKYVRINKLGNNHIKNITVCCVKCATVPLNGILTSKK